MVAMEHLIERKEKKERKPRKKQEIIGGKPAVEYYREKMRNYYNQDNGKSKLRAVAYRFKKLYDNDDEIQNILNKEDVDNFEKIKLLKLFHYNKKYSA